MTSKMFGERILLLNPVVFLWGLLPLTGCMKRPPAKVDNICHIFKQYPQWYQQSLDVQKRWGVLVPVQMAIVHQESKFNAAAKPPRTKLLWIIPWTRPSTAYGYSQALRTTWHLYQKSTGRPFASRNNFYDGVDFIGWYAHQAHQRAGIARNDAYSLYLAYHEGILGYQQRTYLNKKWLIPVANKVAARSKIYQSQLARCRDEIPQRSWFIF